VTWKSFSDVGAVASEKMRKSWGRVDGKPQRNDLIGADGAASFAFARMEISSL
jgi:hypothetical protein